MRADFRVLYWLLKISKLIQLSIAHYVCLQNAELFRTLYYMLMKFAGLIHFKNLLTLDFANTKFIHNCAAEFL